MRNQTIGQGLGQENRRILNLDNKEKPGTTKQECGGFPRFQVRENSEPGQRLDNRNESKKVLFVQNHLLNASWTLGLLTKNDGQKWILCPVLVHEYSLYSNVIFTNRKECFIVLMADGQA